MGEILILEDDQDIGKLISIALKTSGHQVTWILNPKDYNSAVDYDLLITEYKLRDKSSGLEFYQRIKRTNASNLPAILATGFVEEGVLGEALRAGVRDFLPKDQRFLQLLPTMVDRILHDLESERELEAAKRMRVHTMETHHRVKNSFQIVHSLLNMELRRHEVLDKNSIAKVVSHLQGLSLIHDILTENVCANRATNILSAKDLVERLVGLLQGSNPTRSADVIADSVYVDARIASSLAVIVTELIINALKYGKGKISIQIKTSTEERASLKIENEVEHKHLEETGKSKTGSELIEFLAKSDFKSTLHRGFDSAGTYFCELSFPIRVKPGS